MSLIRWNPTRDLTAWPFEWLGIQGEMNRLFDTIARPDEEPMGLPTWTPAVDIAERDDEYLVRMELPGVQKEDIRITIDALSVRMARSCGLSRCQLPFGLTRSKPGLRMAL